MVLVEAARKSLLQISYLSERGLAGLALDPCHSCLHPGPLPAHRTANSQGRTPNCPRHGCPGNGMAEAADIAYGALRKHHVALRSIVPVSSPRLCSFTERLLTSLQMAKVRRR